MKTSGDFLPDQELVSIINFLKQIFQTQQKNKVIIAVSGGIDSVLSLSLLARALDPSQIYPLFLPYAKQDMGDAQLICEWNKIPQENWQTVDITQMVNSFASQLNFSKQRAISKAEKIRLGNIMARCRMIVVFDFAKKLNALVCGTENKSEKFLGYYTRFGDEASDIEPIIHLYKTQVRELAKFLALPNQFLAKSPSAELWAGQTDEADFGFSYTQADQFFAKLEQVEAIDADGVVQTKAEVLAETSVEKQILAWLKKVQFKHKVPYCRVENVV